MPDDDVARDAPRRGRARSAVLLALAMVVSLSSVSPARATPSPDLAQLVVSDRPDRSNPRPYSGALLKGQEYVFVSPSDGIRRVDFFDVTYGRNGSLTSDSAAPFDYKGSSGGQAAAWDTVGDASPGGGDGITVLWAVVHFRNGDLRRLRAEADIANTFPGRVVVTPKMVDSAAGENMFSASWPAVPGAVAYETSAGSTTQTRVTGPTWVDPSYPSQNLSWFSVQALRTMNSGDRIGRPAIVPVVNFPACATCRPGYDPQLLYSLSPDRSNPKPLQGATVRGRLYVFLSTAGLARPPEVTFTIDADNQGAPFNREIAAPFDLAGTGADTLARPLDVSASFTPGRHGIMATACWLVPDDLFCTPVPALFTVTS